MKAFMVISTGNTATDTVPLLATSDPAVIGAAMDALAERAGVLLDPTPAVQA